MNEMLEAAQLNLPEEITPEDQMAIRLRNLETRQTASEEALRSLMTAVKRITPEITSGIMRAFAGVFHSLSDRLLDLSEVSTETPAENFNIIRLQDDHPSAIIIKRTGDHYDFSATTTPDVIQNDGTEAICKLLTEQKHLNDGETGRFSITYSKVVGNDTDFTKQAEPHDSAPAAVH